MASTTPQSTADFPRVRRPRVRQDLSVGSAGWRIDGRQRPTRLLCRSWTESNGRHLLCRLGIAAADAPAEHSVAVDRNYVRQPVTTEEARDAADQTQSHAAVPSPSIRCGSGE